MPALFPDPTLEYTGVLLHHAEVRQKTIDREGHLVPAVVFDIETDSPMHMPLHVEQLFEPGQMHQAEATAKQYRKGQQITVQASVFSVRVAVTASRVIHAAAV